MPDSSDAHLQLKKRARRRLVGAVAFAGLAAVVLPMVMDDEPKQQVQDVQIRIPGQETPFNPKTTKVPVVPVPEKQDVAPMPAQPVVAAKSIEVPVVKPEEKAPEKVVEKKAAKTDKTIEKSGAKSVENHTEKSLAKPSKSSDADSQRVAAILSGKTVDATSATSASSGQYVILIGAFSNSANVKHLQAKLGELGIKVFTESLDSPEGKKTRVRAGPFPNREMADKSLEKMKRIGVNGVVAAKP